MIVFYIVVAYLKSPVVAGFLQDLSSEYQTGHNCKYLIENGLSLGRDNHSWAFLSNWVKNCFGLGLDESAGCLLMNNLSGGGSSYGCCMSYMRNVIALYKNVNARLPA